MVWEGGTVVELEISRNFLFCKCKKNKFNIWQVAKIWGSDSSAAIEDQVLKQLRAWKDAPS